MMQSTSGERATPAAKVAAAGNGGATSDSMSGHMARGAAWMVSMRWAMRLLGLISTVILARLLTPADYGIVAMATIVVGLLQVFTFTTFDLALIQRADAGRAHFDTAWTLQVIQGAALAVTILLVAPFAAAYFDEPRVEPVVQLLAASAFVQGLSNIGTVAFRRDLQFSMEFRFHVVSRLFGFFITVGFAFYLRNYWALVFGLLLGEIISVLMSYIMHPYRPRWSLEKVREIWSFSQWMLFFLIGTYLKNKLDAFFVGRTFDITQMGGYHVASEISTMATNELVMPIGRALFPAYSKLAHGKGEAVGAFENAFAILVMICLPIGVGLTMVAADAVAVILGSKWIDAAPLIQWLAIGAVGSGLTHATGIFLSATGHARINALTAWAHLVVLVPAIWIGNHLWGLKGIAAARTFVCLGFLWVLLAVLCRVHATTLASLWRSVWRSAVATIAMVFVLHQLRGVGIDTPAFRLFVEVVCGGAAFFWAAWLLWWISGQPEGAEKNISVWLYAVGKRLLRHPKKYE